MLLAVTSPTGIIAGFSVKVLDVCCNWITSDGDIISYWEG